MLGETLTRGRFETLVDAAANAPRWIGMDRGQAAADYNRRGFLVRHRLADHPLFTLDALKCLCHRMGRPAVKHRAGVIPADAHFDSSLARYRQGMPFEEAIDHLEERQAYLAVYNPERDPQYRPVIEGLVGELGLALHGLERPFNWYSAYLFISAQDSVTPYHMDREMNFLLQIRGTKTVQLWDPLDDAVMNARQRDHIFSRADDARPVYEPRLAPLARAFELEPGVGVHHPFIAPHLVTTGPALSISLALTFRSTRSDMWSDAHRYNVRMRRMGLGLGCVPVQSIAVLDEAKAAVVRTLRHARIMLKGADAEPARVIP